MMAHVDRSRTLERAHHFSTSSTYLLLCTSKFEVGVVPVRGYAKGGDEDDVAFGGIAA
jgi:hypothetical protein